MPTYQYACTECGERLEAVQKFSDDPLTECPACGGRLRKLFSAVGVVFKGSGFYKTDSRSTARSGSGASTSKDAAAAGSSGDGGSAAGSGSEKAAAASGGSDTASGSSASPSGSASSTSASGSSASGSSSGDGSKVA